MSLVLELQEEAIDANVDVLSLLRKAYLISRKLEIKEFQEWINGELNGYTEKNHIPAYREIKGIVKGYNPYHGWIPVVITNKELEEAICVRKMPEAISDLQHITNQAESGVVSYSFNGEMLAILSEMTGHSANYTLQFPKSSVLNIIEQVKNRVLEWSLILEENNILGEGMHFTSEEKATAKSNPQIINYISNYYGNINASQIQQGTTGSSQGYE